MKFAKLLAAAALTLWTLAYAHPSFAAAFESDASFSDCAACDNGTVELIMDGGSALVRDLAEDPENPGVYIGVGSVLYNAQGVSINDVGAHFEIKLEPSASGLNPLCERASLMATSIRIVGSMAGFVLSSSNFHYDTSTPCYRGLVDVTIDDHPKSVGKLKHLYRGDGKVVTPSGRILKV